MFHRGHHNHLLSLKSEDGFPAFAGKTFLVFSVLLAPISLLGICDILKLITVLCTEQWYCF